jgi:surface carbohydrate biosynthesis protein
MKRFRVALIVDHPLRDLPGLVLVAKHLAENGCDAYLVPMYNQERECLALAPDFVLLNYLRKNNEHFVSRLKACSISYGINDTEGGFYGNMDYYGNVLSRNEDLVSSAKCNLIWGQKVFEYLKNSSVWNHRLVISGLPRFDFYSERFRSVSLDFAFANLRALNLILINTKVAVANPQFISVEKEIDIYRNKLGISEEQIQHFLHYGRLSIADNIELAQELGKAFPESTVIIRPHPHENGQTYSNGIDAGLANVSVYREGPVIPWILKSKVVLHRHCTTAIEAALADIPAIAPDWVRTSANAPDAEAVSHVAQSRSELNDLIKDSLQGRLRPTERITESRARLIDDWLYRVDGLSHVRVAGEIINNLRSGETKTDECVRQLYRIFDHRGDLKGRLFTAMSEMAAVYPSALWKLDKWRLKPWTMTQKFIELDDVKNWLSAVISKDSPEKYLVSKALPNVDYIEKYEGSAIKITR